MKKNSLSASQNWNRLLPTRVLRPLGVPEGVEIEVNGMAIPWVRSIWDLNGVKGHLPFFFLFLMIDGSNNDSYELYFYGNGIMWLS